MNALLALLLPLIATTTTTTAMSTTMKPTTPSGCVHNGQWYPDGAIRDNPCQPCQCHNGYVACAVVDCFVTLCVDAVRDPNQCCPVCPNGHNCRAPDGTVIPADGQLHRIDSFTSCVCRHGGGLGFMSFNEALCTKSAPVVS